MKPNPRKLCAVIAILMAGGAASFSVPSRSARSGILINYDLPFKSSVARNTPLTKAKGASTAFEAVPSWAYYSIGHIIGGTAGAPFVIRATKTWYRSLSLPSWTPPNFLFAPVWTTLYGLMGVSVSRIVKVKSPTANLAMKLWTLHYALNAVWPGIFFGLQQFRLGLIINLSLVSTLGLILPLFYRIDPLSAYLQIPYLVWLSFATILNLTVCKNNSDGIPEAMGGGGYNDEMLQDDIKKLQAAAAKYAGL